MFCDVCLKRRTNLVGLGVLPNHLLDDRILHGVHVHCNMSLVVLIYERLEWLEVHRVHVLHDRIGWLLIILDWHQLGCVLDPQHLQHLPVKLGHVVNLRRSLGQLDHCLILHHPLRHGCRIGVGHGDDLHHVVVALLGMPHTLGRLVVILVIGVVPNDRREQFQLLFEGVVDPSLNRTHHLEHALQQSQRRTHRSLRRHVGNLHICRSGKPSTLFYDGTEQLIQRGTGFFVWQRQDVVAYSPRTNVHIPELARSNGGVVPFNAQSSGF